MLEEYLSYLRFDKPEIGGVEVSLIGIRQGGGVTENILRGMRDK